MPCLFIFLSLKEMLITRYVEMNLWLTDDLAYLHIKFYKNEKFLYSFIVCNKNGFENSSVWERKFKLQIFKLQNSTTHFNNQLYHVIIEDPGSIELILRTFLFRVFDCSSLCKGRLQYFLSKPPHSFCPSSSVLSCSSIRCKKKKYFSQ